MLCIEGVFDRCVELLGEPLDGECLRAGPGRDASLGDGHTDADGVSPGVLVDVGLDGVVISSDSVRMAGH